MSTDSSPSSPSRRRLLQGGVSLFGGMLVGLDMSAHAAQLVGAAQRLPGPGGVELTAWVRITQAREIELIVSQAEIGQGISTTLPAILADELGADWRAVHLLTAPLRPEYRHPKYDWMFTGNSESIQSFYQVMRKMGAAARELLVTAACARWGATPAECRTENSHVVRVRSGERIHFADLAVDAARLPVPQTPALRPDAELRLIGRSLPRVDVPDKVNGKAVFGIDFQVPGMLVAAVRTVPAIGGRLLGFDAVQAKGMPGVHAVVPLPNGVAVVAQRYWQAARALATVKLNVEDTEDSRAADSHLIEGQYASVIEQGPWVKVLAEGLLENESANGGKSQVGVDRRGQADFSATYANPFAAHATMEPMNCVASVSADRCEVWAPTQGQDLAAVALQSALGMAPEKISVNRTPYIGGGFGRRLLPDFVVQAALISKAVNAPVKLIWDREEDMRRDFYRPASALRLTAQTDGKGMPATLHAQLVSPTILLPVFPLIKKTLDEKGFDPSALEGLLEMPYRFAGRRVDFHLAKIAIPTSVMRTTGYGPNLFALECFIDELAQRARQDPLTFRRRLLAHDAHALRVLDRLAVLSRWGRRLPKGHAQGLAFAQAFGTLIGMVVELSVKSDKVHLSRVTTVADCGQVLDPGIARAGIEGGIVFGMAYCKSEVRFERGRIQQDNFSTYVMPYLAEGPEMVVEFLSSDRALGGVGEVGPVTIPPAIANAVFGATGKRIRTLPLARSGLRFG